MSDFMIQSPHTREECQQALEATLDEGPEILAQYEYGCAAGDHTGYALVSVETEREARLMVPAFLRAKAKIVEVEPCTPEEIRQSHR